MATIKNFPDDDWSGNRGCDRESYAQPGYWYNGRRRRPTYYTDAMGQPLAAGDPHGAAAGDLGLRNDRRAGHDRRPQRSSRCAQGYCQQRSRLGLKN